MECFEGGGRAKYATFGSSLVSPTQPTLYNTSQRMGALHKWCCGGQTDRNSSSPWLTTEAASTSVSKIELGAFDAWVVGRERLTWNSMKRIVRWSHSGGTPQRTAWTCKASWNRAFPTRSWKKEADATRSRGQVDRRCSVWPVHVWAHKAICRGGHRLGSCVNLLCPTTSHPIGEAD